MIIRVAKDKDNPYVMMNKAGVNDPRLSFKAKGILSYLLSKPVDWTVRVADLSNHATDGKGAVRSGLKELRECGYATFKRARDDKTKAYTGGEYTIYEVPHVPEPHVENPHVDNPNEENRDPSNNDVVPSIDSTDSSAAEKPPAITSKHPAIQMFKSKAHRYPPKTLYKEIAETVGERPDDIAFWGQVVYGWIKVGWRPTGYEGMLERYCNRDIPTTNKPNRQRANIDASMDAVNQVIQEARDAEP